MLNKDEHLEGLLKKANKGEYLTHKEKTAFCHFIAGSHTNNQAAKEVLVKYCHDNFFIMAYLEHTSPDGKIAALMERTFSREKILLEYLNNFDTTFTSNHADLVNRTLFQEYKDEKKLAEQNYSGDKLKTQIDLIKLKMWYIYILANRLYSDYLHKYGISKIEFNLRTVSIILDVSSLIHIMNRHIIRNHTVLVDYQPGKDLFYLRDLEEIIDTLNYIVPLMDKATDFITDFSDTIPLTVYFKKLVSDPAFAFHTKTAYYHKGGQKFPYQRINSFYPISKAKEAQVRTDHIFRRVRDNFYIFLKK